MLLCLQSTPQTDLQWHIYWGEGGREKLGSIMNVVINPHRFSGATHPTDLIRSPQTL